MKQRSMKWLKMLTEAKGVSGHEDGIGKMISKEMKGLATISGDKLGSVICKKTGLKNGPKIMLPGHMDEVGFMVKSVTKEGFIKFIPVGGWWPGVIMAQRMTVQTSRGEYIGVVGSKAPHKMTEEERKKPVEIKNMFIDIGVKDKDEAEKKFGVRPGDPIIPLCPFTEMADKDYILAKAYDDRVGCALFMDVIAELKNRKHPNVVYGVGTVQEEVGLRGAKTSAAAVDPDVCICLDVGIASDTPGSGEDDANGLGKGPQISVYDGSMIPNTRLRDLFIKTAERRKIPYQLQVMERGGTDAGRVHLHAAGVPSLYLGIATRYIHSSVSVLHKADYDNALKLLLEVIMQLDAKTVARL
ncbi:MAG: peptidase M28 [Planctomycetota bacterium]|nr:MAG: peptidase M28 [Planctomycetota bacterium]